VLKTPKSGGEGETVLCSHSRRRVQFEQKSTYSASRAKGLRGASGPRIGCEQQRSPLEPPRGWAARPPPAAARTPGRPTAPRRRVQRRRRHGLRACPSPCPLGPARGRAAPRGLRSGYTEVRAGMRPRSRALVGTHEPVLRFSLGRGASKGAAAHKQQPRHGQQRYTSHLEQRD